MVAAMKEGEGGNYHQLSMLRLNESCLDKIQKGKNTIGMLLRTIYYYLCKRRKKPKFQKKISQATLLSPAL